jgi:hypothetical protein
MPIRSPRILKLLFATTALLAFPASAHAVSQAPPKPVVGTGTIRVPQLLVRKAPVAGSPVLAKLSEFRPQDYRHRYVLAVGTKKVGAKVAWYKITIPGRPNGRTGCARIRSRATRSRGRSSSTAARG